MPLWISLSLLFAVALTIGYLFVRRSFIDRQVMEFYQSGFLQHDPSPPAELSQHFAGCKVHCYTGQLDLQRDRRKAAFRWWSWLTSTKSYNNGAPSTSIHHHVAVTFEPSQRVYFEQPLAAGGPSLCETLDGGTLRLSWNVLDRAEHYEGIRHWLECNVRLRPLPVLEAREFRDPGVPLTAAERRQLSLLIASCDRRSEDNRESGLAGLQGRTRLKHRTLVDEQCFELPELLARGKGDLFPYEFHLAGRDYWFFDDPRLLIDRTSRSAYRVPPEA